MEHQAPPFFRHGPTPLTRFVFFTLLSLLLLVSDTRFKYLESARHVVAVALYPLQRLAAMPREMYHGMSEYFSTRDFLRSENVRLAQQNLLNSALLQQNQALQLENAHLRQLLEAGARLPGTVTPAEILYAGHDPFTRKVAIDKGAQHGIQPGRAVVDDVGVIGQVTRVFPWLSEVTLITDKDQAVPVQVVRNGLRAVVFGTGNDAALDLRHIPVNADIQHGDMLATSGIDGTYPPGLPVAVVSGIERNPAFAFARISCTPAAGVARYRQVLVVALEGKLPENPLAAEEPQPKGRKSGKAN